MVQLHSFGEQQDIYHKSSDNFCIQGGRVDNGADGTDWSIQITFKKPYKNNNYSVNWNTFRTSDSTGNRHDYMSIVNKTSTGCKFCHYTNSYRFGNWRTEGYIA